jgi:hypothetical protein
MINRYLTRRTKNHRAPKPIVTFGQAELIKVGSTRYRLSAGNDDDATAAKEWMSLFMHEGCLDVQWEPRETIFTLGRRPRSQRQSWRG